ncbi:hypothetical protein PCE1_000690 [Barthelona sp. PCE]
MPRRIENHIVDHIGGILSYGNSVFAVEDGTTNFLDFEGIPSLDSDREIALCRLDHHVDVCNSGKNRLFQRCQLSDHFYFLQRIKADEFRFVFFLIDESCNVTETIHRSFTISNFQPTRLTVAAMTPDIALIIVRRNDTPLLCCDLISNEIIETAIYSRCFRCVSGCLIAFDSQQNQDTLIHRFDIESKTFEHVRTFPSCRIFPIVNRNAMGIIPMPYETCEIYDCDIDVESFVFRMDGFVKFGFIFSYSPLNGIFCTEEHGKLHIYHATNDSIRTISNSLRYGECYQFFGDFNRFGLVRSLFTRSTRGNLQEHTGILDFHMLKDVSNCILAGEFSNAKLSMDGDQRLVLFGSEISAVHITLTEDPTLTYLNMKLSMNANCITTSSSPFIHETLHKLYARCWVISCHLVDSLKRSVDSFYIEYDPNLYMNVFKDERSGAMLYAIQKYTDDILQHEKHIDLQIHYGDVDRRYFRLVSSTGDTLLQTYAFGSSFNVLMIALPYVVLEFKHDVHVFDLEQGISSVYHTNLLFTPHMARISPENPTLLASYINKTKLALIDLETGNVAYTKQKNKCAIIGWTEQHFVLENGIYYWDKQCPIPNEVVTFDLPLGRTCIHDGVIYSIKIENRTVVETTIELDTDDPLEFTISKSDFPLTDLLTRAEYFELKLPLPRKYNEYNLYSFD